MRDIRTGTRGQRVQQIGPYKLTQSGINKEAAYGAKIAGKTTDKRARHVAALKRADEIDRHVKRYAENPREHARALRSLGVPTAEIRQLHQAYSRSNSRQSFAVDQTLEGAMKAAGIKGHVVKRGRYALAGGVGFIRDANGSWKPQRNTAASSAVSHLPGGKFVAKGLSEAAEAGNAIPQGINELRKHPIRVAQQTGRQYAAIGRHPIREFRKHPGYTALAVLPAVGAAGRVAEAGIVGRTAGFGAAAKTLVRPRLKPGTYTLRSGKMETHRLLPSGSAGRVVSRGRNKLLQRSLDKGAPVHPPRRLKAARNFHRENLSAQATFKRELRAENRIRESLSRAPFELQQKALRKAGLSRAEHRAMEVVAIEGNKVFANPGEVIGRHIAKYKKHAQDQFNAITAARSRTGPRGGKLSKASKKQLRKLEATKAALKANQERIRDLRAAEKILTNPSEKFRHVLELTRNLSKEGERALIERDLLTEEIARGRLHKAAQAHGLSEAPADAFYYPLAKRYTEAPLRTPKSMIAGGGASIYGKGTPTPGSYGVTTKRFTTKSYERGGARANIAHTVADAYVRRIRLAHAHDFVESLKKGATKTKESEYQVPLRLTKNVGDDLKRFFAKLEERHFDSPDVAAEQMRSEGQRLAQALHAEDVRAGIGEKVEGVVWIDRRFLDALEHPHVRGGFEKLFDAINNPARSLTLYTRPAYALNLPGNLTMQTVTQGHYAPRAMQRAVVAPRRFHELEVAKIDSGMGTSRTQSYLVETGPLARANEQLARAWTGLTDLWSRRSAFFNAARRLGYKTDADVKRLLNDPALEQDRIHAFRLARRDMVDYDSLTPIERDAIRRYIYFYPWVSRGTVWALRTLVEHPGKVSTLSQLARIGAENAHKQFGDVPDWFKSLVPYGSAKDGKIKVGNFASLNTYSTAVEVGKALPETARAIIGLKSKGIGGLGDFVTPAAGIAAQAASPGGETGRQAGGFLGAMQGLPQAAALKRAGINPHGIFGRPSRTYPETGIGPAIGPYTAGGPYPKTADLAHVQEMQAKAERDAMPPEQRVRLDNKKLRDDLRFQVRKHFGRDLTPQIREALRLRETRAVYLEHAYQQAKKSGKEWTTRDRFDAQVDLLLRLRKINAEQARAAKAWAASTKNEHEIRSEISRVGRKYFGSDILSDATAKIRERGGDIYLSDY